MDLHILKLLLTYSQNRLLSIGRFDTEDEKFGRRARNYFIYLLYVLLGSINTLDILIERVIHFFYAGKVKLIAVFLMEDKLDVRGAYLISYKLSLACLA